MASDPNADASAEAAARRARGGEALSILFARVRERSDLTPEAADELAAEERGHARTDPDVRVADHNDAVRHQ